MCGGAEVRKCTADGATRSYMQAAANGDIGQRTGEAATAWLSGPEALAMEVPQTAACTLHQIAGVHPAA